MHTDIIDFQGRMGIEPDNINTVCKIEEEFAIRVQMVEPFILYGTFSHHINYDYLKKER